MQTAYEFYEDWLETGGEDLELGAHRLTSKQLFWVAAARVYVDKKRSGNSNEEERLSKWNSFFSRKQGFREAFHCDEAADQNR